MTKQLRLLIIAILAVLLLGGCAANGLHSANIKGSDNSSPSYSSIYLYTIASYFRSQGNFSVADALYRKAMSSDPGSTQIRKQVLINALNLHQQGLLGDAEMRALIDSTAVLLSFDEDILYANYAYYEQVADTLAMQNTVQELQSSFPSSRAEIQRFIFEMKYQDKTEIKYLDSALLLAQNDPQSLMILTNIYFYYDLEKAKQALLRLNEIAPTEESSDMLASLIIKEKDVAMAKDWFSKLEYPAGKEAMQFFADEAMKDSEFGLLCAVSADILATRDLGLLIALSFAALMDKRPDLLEAISALLPDINGTDADKQPINSLLIAHSIHSREKYPLDAQIAKLSALQSFDDILAYYTFAATADIPAGGSGLSPATYDLFSDQVSLRLADEAPARYLQSVVKAVQDSTSQLYIEARFDLLLYLKQRATLSAKDYELLMNQYYAKGMLAQRRTLLEEAIGHYPDNAMFCNDLGYYLLMEGTDPDSAAALIQRALDSEPENPFYLDSLAWYHYLVGDYDQALTLSDIPQKMENMPAEIAWHIGAIYLKLNDLTNARSFLEKCVAIGGDPVPVDLAKQALQLLP